MAGDENVIPEVSFPDESSSNCPNSEFANCRSKSFQPDSREVLRNGVDSDELRKPPIYVNDISTSTTKNSCNENEDEIDNDECKCDDVSSIGSVPESLENIVRDAEQVIDQSLDEFLTMADRIEEIKIDFDYNAEDFDTVTATSTATINSALRNIIDSSTTSTSSTGSHIVDH
jgi:hypothetical protein